MNLIPSDDMVAVPLVHLCVMFTGLTMLNVSYKS